MIGGLFFISIVICCIVFACRRLQASHGRVIATNTSTGLPQLNPPHPCQVPPAFQQTYTCYPPPQLEQQQTLTPPQPYNPEATEVNEPPPLSYIEVTQGRSGGVYTPSDPLPSPSAPPPMDWHQSRKREDSRRVANKASLPLSVVYNSNTANNIQATGWQIRKQSL